MSEFLSQEIDRLEKELGTVANITDPSLFDISTPLNEKIINERTEINDIAKNILEFLKININCHSVVHGLRGSGKTSLTKYLITSLKNKGLDFEYKYINCKNITTSYGIIKEFVNVKRKTDYNLVLNRFMSQIKKNNKKVIVVLDELNFLKDDLFFYNISRDPAFSNINLVILTKSPVFFNFFSEDVKSSFKCKTVTFIQYNKHLIFQIIKKRAELGLVRFDDRYLKIIADLTASDHFKGDIRIALRTVEEVFKYPDFEKKIKIDEAAERISNMMELEDAKLKDGLMFGLSLSKLRILHLIAEHKYSSTVYKNYLTTYRSNISKYYFFKLIEDLEALDLISSLRVKKGSTNVIEYKEKIYPSNMASLNNWVNMRKNEINPDEKN